MSAVAPIGIVRTQIPSPISFTAPLAVSKSMGMAGSGLVGLDGVSGDRFGAYAALQQVISKVEHARCGCPHPHGAGGGDDLHDLRDGTIKNIRIKTSSVTPRLTGG
jgi:hypothetical protein